MALPGNSFGSVLSMVASRLPPYARWVWLHKNRCREGSDGMQQAITRPAIGVAVDSYTRIHYPTKEDYDLEGTTAATVGALGIER